MSTDVLMLAAWASLGLFIALPSLAAWHQKLRSREGAQVATALADFALAVRSGQQQLPVEDMLLARARRLRLAEMIAFEFVCQLPGATPGLVADAAQRLASRLRRRVAFERKMLARTASGRRRGALAAAIPAVATLVLGATGVSMPLIALGLLLSFEALGCWLLWRIARVEA